MGTLGRSWGALGGPRPKKSRKPRFVPHGSGTFLERFLVIAVFFSQKSALQECVFCGVLFLSGIGLNFHRFLRRWNHENLNSVREWHQNQEMREIESGAAPGAILGAILAHFWEPFGTSWTPLDEKVDSKTHTEKHMEKKSCRQSSDFRAGGTGGCVGP